MNCWRIQNLVAAFLDGVLCREEEDLITHHLEACSECKTLVEGIAALPDLPYSTLDEDLEEALFAGFEDSLAERIERSLTEGVGSYGRETEGAATGLMAAYSPQAAHAQASGHLSPALATAYLAAIVLLTAGVAWNYLQVERLEQSVAQRDEIIDTLQQRLLTIDLEREAGFSFSANGLAATGPVFMPAAAPRALPPSSLPDARGYGRQAPSSSPYRQVSLEGLRVIH